MVKKRSKLGLNTGNTIRRYPHEGRLEEYQRYSCLLIKNGVGENDSYAAQDATKDIADMLPYNKHDGVEYSLNKQSRWELPECLKSRIEEEADSAEVQVTATEYDINTPNYGCVGVPRRYTYWGSNAWPIARPDDISQWPRCRDYFSNAGATRHSHSSSATGMTIKSAKRGHRMEDHLSKAERRKRKDDESVETNEATSPILPTLECHVAYGPSASGKLYQKAFDHQQRVFRYTQELTLFPRAVPPQVRRIVPEAGSGYEHYYPSKESKKKSLVPDSYTDENEESDSEIEMAEKDGSQRSSASLSDFIHFSPKRSKRKRKKRSRCRRADDLTNDNKRVKLVCIPSPKGDVQSPVAEPLTDFIALHELVEQSDMCQASLLTTFGDNYQEANCVPRTIALDLSQSIKTEANGDRLYMMMFQMGTGCGKDVYRVSCYGDYRLSKLSELDRLPDARLSTLIATVLDYSIRVGTPGTKRSVAYFTGINSGVVSSTAFHDLIKPAVTTHQQVVDNEVGIYKGREDEDIVVIPPLKCAICLEDIDSCTPHTAVLPCQHDFCNKCWNRHIYTSIYHGLVHITCMEYRCNTQLDSVFIMSMVAFSTYSLFEVLLVQKYLSSTQMVKWCPTVGCCRLLHCDPALVRDEINLTVRCACGVKYCFGCLKEPHWPLTCQQMTSYQKRLVCSGLNPWLCYQEMTKLSRAGWCECLSHRARMSLSCKTSYHFCGLCCHLYCFKCYKIYNQGIYHHRCHSGLPSWRGIKQLNAFRDSLPRHNEMLALASYHRGYRLPSSCPPLVGYMRQLLNNTRHSEAPTIPATCCQQFSSLHDFLVHVVRQILATHNLLDYCCAVNVFRKGYKCCAHTISSLSYSVGVLERELASPRCNQQTVDKMTKYYDIVKSNTRLLIQQMSGVLSFVTPKQGRSCQGTVTGTEREGRAWAPPQTPARAEKFEMQAFRLK